MVILDTNILIDHLRISSKKKSLLQAFVSEFPHEELAVSLITVQELYEGRSTRLSEKEDALLGVLSGMKILPYTYQVAKIAGILARDLSRPIELADSAIAATCLVHDAKLYTLNTKDFLGINELQLIGN